MHHFRTIYQLTLLLLTFISCGLTDKHWADWKESEKKFIDNKNTFDSLTYWLLTNFQDRQQFIYIDNLPTDKKEIAKNLDIKNIFIDVDFCAINDTRGGHRLAYQFNGTKTVAGRQIFFYLIYARCLPSDFKKNIKTNGTYKNIEGKWYLVQKNYDWHFD